MNRNFELIGKEMNFNAVKQEITEHEERFNDFLDRQNFEGSPFKDTRCIPCRMTFEDDVDPSWSPEEILEYRKTKGVTNINAIDCPIYESFPAVYHEVMKIAGFMQAEQLGRVIIAELKPGGHILPHYDYGAYHDFYDRLHLVISGKGCHFRVGREIVKMLPGEIWLFNNRAQHEVWNDSDEARYHVVIDLKLKGSRVARWPRNEEYKNNA